MNVSHVCNKKLCNLIFLAIVMVLGGCFFVPSSYGQAQTQTVGFSSDFESTSTSLCGGNDIHFWGTAHFLFHETVDEHGGVHQNTEMNYFKGTGTDLYGGRYKIVETDHFIVNVNDKIGVFHTVLNGELLHEGKPTAQQTHTGVTINLLTVLDENGQAKTTVERIDVRCRN